MFKYKSDLVLSKSWLNRALLIQAYLPDLNVNFESTSEDVLVLKKALQNINHTSEFYLGLGGTSFRFFCLFISRRPGRWLVKVHPRLLERPQKDLKILLNQLGVEIHFEIDHVIINSSGWKIPDIILAEAQDSSQFVSALLLNSWSLPQVLNLKIKKPIVSDDYLKMTIEMLQQFDLKIQMRHEDSYLQIEILKNQMPTNKIIQPEVDVSSAFSLVGAAVIDGEVEITNWNSKSLQPDFIFLKLFDEMNIKYNLSERILKVVKQNHWKSIKVNLSHFPDLFPVLSVLGALAEGQSDLFGAEQLKYKESNRLLKTKELLDLTGFRSELKKDGLIIYGQSSTQDKNKIIIFNPDHDHRMAMAAGLLKLSGFQIQIENPEVVNKSYPTFWKDIGLQS